MNTSTILSSRGNVLSIAAAALAAAAIAAVAITTVPTLTRTTAPSANVSLVPWIPTDREVMGTLGRLGLAPRRLAAAGVSAAETTTLVANARTYLDSNIDALRAADEAFASAKRAEDELRRTIQAGQASPEELGSRTTVVNQLATATTNRQTLLNGAFAAATAGLDSTKVARLNTANAHGDWGLPLPYLFTARTEHQWIALRDALANQRISAALGQDADPACTALVATSSAESATALASSSLQANEAAVTAAWDQAVNR